MTFEVICIASWNADLVSRVPRPMARGETLMAHAAHWGDEPQPLLRDLERLTNDERAVFDALRDNRLRVRVRLEQERIGFGWVQQALAELLASGLQE